ncbi:hypothetical protein [Acidisoma sp. 7E03]
MRSWSVAWLTALLLLRIGPADAQALRHPLAQAGSWAVVVQDPAAGVLGGCMIVAPAAAVAIRSDARGYALMVANAHWDLPKAMQGTLRLTLGAQQAAFPVVRASANTALAPIDAASLPSLLAAMLQASALTVTIFPGMPVHVPLSGFATVLPAFRHCAGMHG